MLDRFTLLIAIIANLQSRSMIAMTNMAVMLTLVLVAMLFKYGALWLQAYMSGTKVSLVSLVGMTLRRVPEPTIVTAKIMVRQAELGFSQQRSLRTEQFEAHFWPAVT